MLRGAVVQRDRHQPPRTDRGGRCARRHRRSRRSCASGTGAGQAPPHRRASSRGAAELARRDEPDRPQQPAAHPLVGAEDARGHGQGRGCDLDRVADVAAGDAAWQRSCGQDRPRGERVRQEADGRSPRPLRRVRDAAAALHRRKLERDRLRLRYAQGRRHRHDDELRRQVARLRLLRPDLGGVEPPQGHRLYASDRRQLLRQPGARPGRLGDRVGHRHHAHAGQSHLQRQDAEIPRHQLHLVARRRRAGCVRRTLPDPVGEHAAVSRQVHARAGAGRAQPLLLRHRAGFAGRNPVGAREARAGLADRVRHGLPVPDRGRPHPGHQRHVQRRRSCEDRP